MEQPNVGHDTSLPSIDAPQGAACCDYCGEPVQIVEPLYCGACADRLKTEKRIVDGNEFRRRAQIAMDLDEVRRRTRAHVGGNGAR